MIHPIKVIVQGMIDAIRPYKGKPDCGIPRKFKKTVWSDPLPIRVFASSKVRHRLLCFSVLPLLRLSIRRKGSYRTAPANSGSHQQAAAQANLRHRLESLTRSRFVHIQIRHRFLFQLIREFFAPFCRTSQRVFLAIPTANHERALWPDPLALTFRRDFVSAPAWKPFH